MSRVLVIDDEASIRESLDMILTYEGQQVIAAADARAGIAILEREDVDLVLGAPEQIRSDDELGADGQRCTGDALTGEVRAVGAVIAQLPACTAARDRRVSLRDVHRVEHHVGVLASDHQLVAIEDAPLEQPHLARAGRQRWRGRAENGASALGGRLGCGGGLEARQLEFAAEG